MKYQEFVQAIDKGKVTPLYYLYGDEPYLMEKCVRKLLEQLVSPDLRDFNLNVYYGTETKGEEIAEAAATLPMFASWRVVLVKKADALSASSLEVLSSYIRHPSPSTCLVLQGEKIDQRKKFFSELKKTGELVEFKRLYENQLPAFIRNEASLRGKKIEPAAADMLVYLAGNNLQELVSELEKAILYVGEGGEIQVSHIRAIVSDTRVNSVFELTDSLGEKNLERALRSLDTLLNDGEAPLLVLAMITRHYRQIWKVRELLDKRTPTQDIGKIAGINPYFLQGILRQARNYSVVELRWIFERIFEIDGALKTGGGKPRILLESLLMDVCSKAPARSA
ncbi:MAG: DNA polymerase III subunit delta [Geobacteraceae bacterium]|nr:DNA polymerase III subunit delta [Geobacteraceae bacterium]